MPLNYNKLHCLVITCIDTESYITYTHENSLKTELSYYDSYNTYK